VADRLGQQFGNYRLIAPLGQGSYAEVYLGQHVRLDLQAAIKVLHTHLTGTEAEHFQQEAQTIARLAHPAIVRIFDFDVQDGVPFLVMDYAPNGSLRRRYPKGSMAPLPQILPAIKQVAAALQYAHEQKFIHRDVKPENMLVGRHQEVLLADFGLAALAHSTSSQGAQATSGTLPYMAPEQIEGYPRPASDQYALAVVVYEWLCGERPFEGSAAEVIVKHLNMPPPPLRERVPMISPEVEQVVLRALAKDPKARFGSVQTFGTVLERASQLTPSHPTLLPAEQILPDPSAASVYATLAMVLGQPADSTKAIPPEDHAATPDELAFLTGPSQPLHIDQQYIPGRDITFHQPLPLGAALNRRNRARMLERVRVFWINGVLEQSLHGAALIALDLHERSDLIESPWRLAFQESDGSKRSLPSGTRIIQVYDEAGGELLILGEPGSGKTTLLLELARDLLDRARHDDTHPIPVVFNLSSWASKRQPLDLWLIEELNTKYQVPRKVGTSWVETDQVLPLLDGLDEVAPGSRAACVEAINSYRLQHGLVPTVVCSRSAEYLAQTAHISLYKAVVVQPLTEQQIDAYLSSAGKQLESVRAALRADPTLQELATTPLMLSVLTLAYHGRAAEDLLVAGSAEGRRRVFEHYVERMLSRRGTGTPYPSQHTRRWLAWLARQMKQHSQTVFYIERMQPDWLPKSRLHRLYYRAIVRLGMGIASGLIIALAIGIAVGLFIGTGKGPGSGVVSGLIGGIVSGLAGGLVIALTSRIETEIQPAEVVVWSWRRLVQVRSLKNKLIVGISSGLTLALLMGLAFVISSSGTSARALFLIVLAIALVVVAIIALAGGLTSGVASTLQHERDLTLPNQGMRRSVRNGIRIGIIGGLVGGSISIMAFSLILTGIGTIFAAGLVGRLCFLLLCGSLGGTISGLIVGLPNGGIAYIQHMALRLLLWRSNLMPWNYPRFLNLAAEHILLRKVGGGYIFIHRSLLDYFASLEAVSPLDEA